MSANSCSPAKATTRSARSPSPQCWNATDLLNIGCSFRVTWEMTPSTPSDTLAASSSGSPAASTRTFAYPSLAGAGVTILMPFTYSCTAEPFPHTELPCAPVERRPPTVTPSQYGECGSARPAPAAASISSASVTPLSTVIAIPAASTATTRFSALVLMARPRPSPAPGQDSFGTLCPYRVAAFILVPDAAAAATTRRSSSSDAGYAAAAARHVDRSGNAAYALVTVQRAVPDAQWTGSAGGLAPAARRRCTTTTA
ncbi:Os02g0124650, partial [Oryza sativa Japonica Group]